MFKWAPLPELATMGATIANMKDTWEKKDLKKWLTAHFTRQIKWLDEEDWNKKS